MPQARFNTLFLCTANSARSIMAEAILRHAAPERFVAFSAGSRPAGVIDPVALELLGRLGIFTEGLHGKSRETYAGADAPRMDFVLTVCDRAAGETCPTWPGKLMTAHRGIADPAMAGGDAVRRPQACRTA